MRMFKVLFDYRRYEKPTIIQNESQSFWIIAIVQTISKTPEYYVSMLDLQQMKLYVEKIKSKDIYDIDRMGQININELLRIEDDTEWNEVYTFLDDQTFFRYWQNKTKEEIITGKKRL